MDRKYFDISFLQRQHEGKPQGPHFGCKCSVFLLVLYLSSTPTNKICTPSLRYSSQVIGVQLSFQAVLIKQDNLA